MFLKETQPGKLKNCILLHSPMCSLALVLQVSKLILSITKANYFFLKLLLLHLYFRDKKRHLKDSLLYEANDLFWILYIIIWEYICRYMHAVFVVLSNILVDYRIQAENDAKTSWSVIKDIGEHFLDYLHLYVIQTACTFCIPCNFMLNYFFKNPVGALNNIVNAFTQKRTKLVQNYCLLWFWGKRKKKSFTGQITHFF